jgi:thiamine biosynthesis protein ThiS
MTNTRVVADSVALTVNGSRKEVAAGSTVADLLRDLDIDPRMVVVEHNRDILRDRAAHDTRVLGDGDNLEIVHFVGGG